MATLNEAPEQLRQWIKELDGQIGMLNEQRDMLASVLGILDGSAFAPEPAKPPLAKGMPARLKSKAAEKRSHKTNVRKYDYTEVARVANAALRAGEPSRRAVAKRFSISVEAAGKLIQSARADGHEIAASKSGRPRNPAPTNVTPITPSDVNVVVQPAASRAFTPADTLRIIEGG